jgi:hypothetical protein
MMMNKAEDTLLEHLAFQTFKFALESKNIPIERAQFIVDSIRFSWKGILHAATVMASVENERKLIEKGIKHVR